MDEVLIGSVERLRVPAFAFVPHLPAALQQRVALTSADARQQVQPFPRLGLRRPPVACRQAHPFQWVGLLRFPAELLLGFRSRLT